VDRSAAWGCSVPPTRVPTSCPVRRVDRSVTGSDVSRQFSVHCREPRSRARETEQSVAVVEVGIAAAAVIVRSSSHRDATPKILGGRKSPTSYSLPIPLLYLSFPSPLLPALPFSSLTLEVGPLNAARESRQRSKLLQRGLGRSSPAEIKFGAFDP